MNMNNTILQITPKILLDIKTYNENKISKDNENYSQN